MIAACFVFHDQNADDLPGTPNPDLNGFRGSIATKGDFSLSSWWKYGWDVTLETDDSFRRFYRLDSILLTDRVNQLYFTGMSERLAEAALPSLAIVAVGVLPLVILARAVRRGTRAGRSMRGEGKAVLSARA